MEIRKQSPSIEVLYDYLFASDVLILHRNPCDGVVVSSAAYQCLGSGCPILALESNFFETLGDVVITYSDFWEFKDSLLDILHGGERYQASQRALEEFIRINSTESIARQYIELFHALREERKPSISHHSISSVVGTMASVRSGNEGRRPIPAEDPLPISPLSKSGRKRLLSE